MLSEEEYIKWGDNQQTYFTVTLMHKNDWKAREFEISHKLMKKYFKNIKLVKARMNFSPINFLVAAIILDNDNNLLLVRK